MKVAPDCSLPGHPEVFVVGDMMAFDDLPAVAEVAMQSAVHAARTIARRLEGDATPRPFRYRDLGSMATVARYRAVVSIHGIRLAGFLGWLLWAFVHLTFLTGFKNRFLALMEWTLAFVGRARNERTITLQQIAGRVIAEESGFRPEDLAESARRRRLSPHAMRTVRSGAEVSVVLPRLRRVQRVARVARDLTHLRARVAERDAQQPGRDPGRDRVHARSAVEPQRRLIHDPTLHPLPGNAARPGSAFANSAQVAPRPT